MDVYTRYRSDHMDEQEALGVADASPTQLHQWGYANADDARHRALEVLARVVRTLRAQQAGLEQ